MIRWTKIRCSTGNSPISWNRPSQTTGSSGLLTRKYSRRVTEYLSTVRRGHEEEMPARLTQYKEAQAYYGVVGEVLARLTEQSLPNRNALQRTSAIAIEKILGKIKRRDWTTKDDALKDMQNAIDDYLFEVRSKYEISFSTIDMDEIIYRCLSIAKKQARQ